MKLTKIITGVVTLALLATSTLQAQASDGYVAPELETSTPVLQITVAVVAFLAVFGLALKNPRRSHLDAK